MHTTENRHKTSDGEEPWKPAPRAPGVRFRGNTIHHTGRQRLRVTVIATGQKEGGSAFIGRLMVLEPQSLTDVEDDEYRLDVAAVVAGFASRAQFNAAVKTALAAHGLDARGRPLGGS